MTNLDLELMSRVLTEDVFEGGVLRLLVYHQGYGVVCGRPLDIYLRSICEAGIQCVVTITASRARIDEVDAVDAC